MKGNRKQETENRKLGGCAGFLGDQSHDCLGCILPRLQRVDYILYWLAVALDRLV